MDTMDLHIYIYIKETTTFFDLIIEFIEISQNQHLKSLRIMM